MEHLPTQTIFRAKKTGVHNVRELKSYKVYCQNKMNLNEKSVKEIYVVNLQMLRN